MAKINSTVFFYYYVSTGLFQPIFYGDLIYKLLKKAKCSGSPISSVNKLWWIFGVQNMTFQIGLSLEVRWG